MIKIDGYPIDCVLDESLAYESDVAEHPVEKGADITDHVRAKLPVLTFTDGVVSDTPIGEVANDVTRRPVAATILHSEDAYRRFVLLHEAQDIVEVECSYGVFDRMVLTSLSTNKTAQTKKSFHFTAVFKQIRIVENKRTVVRVSTPIAQKKDEKGLSLDNVVEGNRVLWRKGKPPGTSPATDPAGVIVGQEIVYVIKGHHYHSDKKTRLSEQELLDFDKDFNRDAVLASLRANKRIQDKIESIDDRLAKAQKMLDYKTAHPGEMPDKALFGL